MANILAPPRFEDIIADAEMYFASQSARATDFNPGSVVRTILEIVAQIQERRDVAVWASLERAIDEAVFDAWGFPRVEATPATGQITLYPGVGQTQPITVRQGDLFRVPNSPTLIYEAVSISPNIDGTTGWVSSTNSTIWVTNPNIPASTLNIRAIAPGKTGNVGAKLITQAIQTIPGIAEIKNLQALTNGRDASTDADRRAAFTAYIQSLPRGTIESLKYGAKTTTVLDNFGLVIEQVRKVAVLEGTSPTPLGISTLEGLKNLYAGDVAVIIDNGTAVMSSTLLGKCKDILNGYVDEKGIKHDGYRAAGIKTYVYQATELPIAVHVEILVAKGFLLDQVVELSKLAIQNVINVLDVGESLLYNDLLMFLKLIPGVLDVRNLTINTLVQDFPPTLNGLVTLGTISGLATLGSQTADITYPQSV